MIEGYFDDQERKSKTIKSITIGCIVAFIVVIILVLFLNRIVPLKKIIVSEENIKLNIGDTYEIKYTLDPAKADNPNITFVSSHPEIVYVDSTGIATVKSYSEEDITLTIKSLKYDVKKDITVDINRPNFIRDIKFEQNKISLNYGETLKLNPIFSPEDAYIGKLTWESSNSNVVSVSENGEIKAQVNTQASATITIKTQDGVSASVEVTIVPKQEVVKVSGIKFGKSEMTLKYGSSITLKPIFTPSNATNKKVKYTSSDTSVLKVDANGKVTASANKDATATITATTEDGAKTAQVRITVKQVETKIKVSGVKITSSNNTLFLNKKSNNTLTLTAEVSPSNAANKNVTWSSSNQAVATVDSRGIVTPKSLGETKITVKTNDGGKTATYMVYVKQKVVMVLSSTQGVNMLEYMKEYTSSNSNYYSQSSNTLRFVFYSNTGFDYQYDKGFTTAKNFLNNGFGENKKYTDVSIFFTLTDPMVKSLTCDSIKAGSTHKTALNKFNSKIDEIKNLGYTVKGYVISHSPLNEKHSLASKNKIVTSDSTNACTSGYSSNWKSYLSNNVTSSAISTNNYPNLKYIDNWSNYLKLRSESGKTFNSVRTFNSPTSNPFEWDKSSTIDFMNLAFKQAGI